eukprot:EG_transcript_2881
MAPGPEAGLGPEDGGGPRSSSGGSPPRAPQSPATPATVGSSGRPSPGPPSLEPPGQPRGDAIHVVKAMRAELSLWTAAAVTLQRAGRGLLGRWRYRQDLAASAILKAAHATIIQCWARVYFGFLFRQRLQQAAALRRHCLARRLQRWWWAQRGARQAQQRALEQEQERAQVRAALVLQRAWGTWVQRKLAHPTVNPTCMGTDHGAALRLQCWWRRCGAAAVLARERQRRGQRLAGLYAADARALPSPRPTAAAKVTVLAPAETHDAIPEIAAEPPSPSPGCPRAVPKAERSTALALLQCWCRAWLAAVAVHGRRPLASSMPAENACPAAVPLRSYDDAMLVRIQRLWRRHRWRLETCHRLRAILAASIDLLERMVRGRNLYATLEERGWDRLMHRELEEWRGVCAVTVQACMRHFLAAKRVLALNPNAARHRRRRTSSFGIERCVTSTRRRRSSDNTKAERDAKAAFQARTLELLSQRQQRATALMANEQRFWERLGELEAEERRRVPVAVVVQRFGRAWLAAARAADRRRPSCCPETQRFEELEGFRVLAVVAVQRFCRAWLATAMATNLSRPAPSQRPPVLPAEERREDEMETQVGSTANSSRPTSCSTPPPLTPPPRNALPLAHRRSARLIWHQWQSYRPRRAERRQLAAASRIQCAWRCFAARRARLQRMQAARELRSQRQSLEDRRDVAAVALQCLWRRYAARRTAGGLRAALS